MAARRNSDSRSGAREQARRLKSAIVERGGRGCWRGRAVAARRSGSLTSVVGGPPDAGGAASARGIVGHRGIRRWLEMKMTNLTTPPLAEPVVLRSVPSIVVGVACRGRRIAGSHGCSHPSRLGLLGHRAPGADGGKTPLRSSVARSEAETDGSYKLDKLTRVLLYR